MLFNSFVFLGLFLPLNLVLFWLIPGNHLRQYFLLLSSLIFYGYFYPPYLILLILLVGLAWCSALLLDKKKNFLILSTFVCLMLGSLLYFKYIDFLFLILQDVGLHVKSSANHTALPLGISFIVFQAIGYVVDVYRKEISAEKNFLIVLLFKAFFPQLIAGPICRAHELMPQLKVLSRFNLQTFCSGFYMLAIGFFLKVFFADGLSPLVDILFNKNELNFFSGWAAALGFGFQIYADFWGYSTMAVGVSMMFGINLPINFNLPYISMSLREFWRRWHITLSQWLRDYLYKPIGGSRNGNLITAFSLLITMLLGGLWHGANYTFLVWGVLHGAILTIEHFFPVSLRNSKSAVLRMCSMCFSWCYTTIIIFISWVFFRAINVEQAMKIIKSMFNVEDIFLKSVIETNQKNIFITVLILFLLQFPFEFAIRNLKKNMYSISTCIYMGFFLILLGYVLSSPISVPFIYFQF